VRRALALLIALVPLAPAGCGDDVDKTAACQLGEAQQAATVQDRKVIGAAAPYAPDLALAARDDELRTSIAARRQAAWQVVERALAPVPLAAPELAETFGGQPTVPAWHTWYAREDFERVFKKLYRDLGPGARQARAPLSAAAIDAGFAWNAVALDEVPEWPEERYLDYLAEIDTEVEVHGIAGISRVGYSPGATRHLIASYARQYACRLAADPEPFEPQPVRAGSPVEHVERLSLASCDWTLLGPFAAGNARVKVTSRGDGDADLYVRRGAAPTTTSFDCRSRGATSTEACEVDGHAPVWVAVFGAAPGDVEVTIEYLAEDVADPTCLDGELPRDAVLIKADWRRQLGAENLPYFDTSAVRMAERLTGKADHGPGDGSANPDPSAIYSLVLPNGNAFRLAGLHIMTKELDHWLWITLWWSPDPDADFGADRPASIAALPGPWRNYKMCVATQYLEGDPDPRGGLPCSLGDALAAVHRGSGSPTWCSNPYLELGEGNAATNCIGCHQHGGTELTAETILATLPHHGSTRVRNNFFTDYLWALKGGRGDDLSSIVQAEVDYWDANDP
jgi:hypothetical protein